MERGNVPIDRWLDQAVSGIRFGPDRAAVRAELEAHMEDKAADLQRIFPGISREEAEERALSEMGDPAEIGKELAGILAVQIGGFIPVHPPPVKGHSVKVPKLRI